MSLGKRWSLPSDYEFVGLRRERRLYRKQTDIPMSERRVYSASLLDRVMPNLRPQPFCPQKYEAGEQLVQ